MSGADGKAVREGAVTAGYKCCGQGAVAERERGAAPPPAQPLPYLSTGTRLTVVFPTALLGFLLWALPCPSTATPSDRCFPDFQCRLRKGGGAQKGHPGAPTDRGRSNTDTQDAGATPGGTRASTAGAQQGRRGNQDREPEWRGWESVRMGGSDNKGDGLASQPCRYRVPGQPLLNRHQVGGVSRSPDGLFAQQEREPIRGRPAVRGKGTYGERPGQCVEEQGTWASRARKHSEAG